MIPAWLDSILLFIGIFGIGLGLPWVLGLGWMKWIEKASNKFLFLRNYLIITQLVLSFLYLFEMGSYFPPQVSLFHIVIKSPARYWYYFLYMITSILLILQYTTPYGRTKTGARIGAVIAGFNLPLGFIGVGTILWRSTVEYFPDHISVSLLVFKWMFSFCILIISWGWSVVFGKLPATLYITSKGLQTNVYNEETFVGQLTKWIAESFKEMEEEIERLK